MLLSPRLRVILSQVLVRHHPDVRVLVIQEGEEHLDGHDEAFSGLRTVLAALAAHQVSHRNAVRNLILLGHCLVKTD